MTETVRIDAVTKRCRGGVEAVRNLSFTLAEGETVALVGHNGAGKTTLIKMLLGLIRPTAGAIRVLGEDPARGSAAVRCSLGYLPESVSFHMALTGRETLAFYAKLKRVGMTDANRLFDRVGLAATAVDRPVKTYSKGMRQRLGLAQALLGSPRILFLDEPTNGLDPALRRNFYALIDELRASGTTVLLSSHALSELEDRAGRVVILDRGIRVADGTLDELRRIACLPARIRVRPVTNGIGGHDPADWHDIGGGWLETEALPEGKLALLHDLTADPAALNGLSVIEPTLDDLYAHFLESRRAAQ